MKRFLLIISAVVTVTSAGRVDLTLKDKVSKGLVTEAIIELPQITGQIEANTTLQSLSGDEKVTELVSNLQKLTSSSQFGLVAAAQDLGLETVQFWASNIILVKGLTLEKLVVFEKIEANFVVREQNVVSILDEEFDKGFNASQGPQWGVVKIRAPEVWGSLTTGEGSVVAIIDTGVNLGHVALSPGYAGAWLDPYYNTPDPTDQQGRGSHIMGTILGRENGVGVAPGARWIACRGLNHQGSGKEAVLTQCAQFMLMADPRPHVVSNSWGGGSGQTWFNAQINAWRAAGIIPIFGIGNSGSSCRTANSPGDQPNVISVGATTPTEAVGSFSSRGPSSNGSLKPDFVAPGSNIVSCGTGPDNYVTMLGTSMSAPHMAGAVALYVAHFPTHTFAEVYDAFARTAVKVLLSDADRNCGFPGKEDYPNYVYGHGRIDVAAAMGL